MSVTAQVWADLQGTYLEAERAIVKPEMDDWSWVRWGLGSVRNNRAQVR